MRFLLGAAIAPAHAPNIVETGANVGRWGTPALRVMVGELALAGVQVLPMPRPPAGLLSAAWQGRRAGVETVRNRLQGEIEMAYADLQKNLEQSRLYRDSILPQAEINYRAAREAYVVGKIDFLTLVRAATNLDRYRQEAAMRASGIGRALAALQKASGLPLIAGTPGAGDSHGEK